MKRHAGFTLIELLITISIMVILLALSVVTLRSNQANARDEERKTDVSVIAQQLESYFKSGSDDAMYTAGEYPPTSYMGNEVDIRKALRDLDPKVLRAPGVADASPISFTVAADTAVPTPTTSAYIYQPLTTTGALCQAPSDECRKFTIYYQLETVPAVQSIVSKNQ